MESGHPHTQLRKGASLILPVLLVADIVFGGAVSGGPIANAALQVVSCFVLIWCILDVRLRTLSAPAKWLISIVALAALICVLQMVPLPYDWWSRLSGRTHVVEAFRTIGVGETAAPLSLAPDHTLSGVLKLLPPVALFVLAAKLRWADLTAHLRWTIVLIAFASAALGLAQTYLTNVPALFPYGLEGRGSATGLFQVVNHQATLQLMAIPFIGAIFARLRARFDAGDAQQAEAVAGFAVLVLSATGLVMSGSVAGYIIALPVSAATLFVIFDSRPSASLIVVGLIAACGVGALAYIAFTSPMLRGLGVTDFGMGALSRREIYRGTLEMAQAYWPWGAGLGSFESAYAAFENPLTVTQNFVIHAHDEYLEIAAELGLAGCIAILALVSWWGIMTARIWRAPLDEPGRLKRAASLAVGVVLAHSLVDFPARTEAIACLGALCLGLMASGPTRSHRTAEIAQAQPSFRHKHVEI